MFDKNKYLNSCLAKHYLPVIDKIAHKFYKSHSISFLSYIKQYDNGKTVELTSHIDWMSHRVNHFNNKNAIAPRLNIGLNHWNKLKNIMVDKMQEVAKSQFSIDAVIEFVYRDTSQKCFHLYSFYAEPVYADNARVFYSRHKAKLLRLIAEINNLGNQYLNNSSEQEIATQVMGYHFKQESGYDVHGYMDMLDEKLFYKLSDHEMEIITLYGAGGFTAKQIAEFINKSPKTVEYHIGQIRNRTNLKDRQAMNAYAREKGWDKLVNFYSNLSTVIN